MELQHLFFDFTEELSRQGYFQWVCLLRATGTPENSVIATKIALNVADAA